MFQMVNCTLWFRGFLYLKKLNTSALAIGVPSVLACWGVNKGESTIPNIQSCSSELVVYRLSCFQVIIVDREELSAQLERAIRPLLMSSEFALVVERLRRDYVSMNTANTPDVVTLNRGVRWQSLVKSLPSFVQLLVQSAFES